MRFLTLLFLSVLFSTQAMAETAAERVLKTGVLRCGYGTSYPNMYREMATGEMKGAYTEVLFEAAKLLNLKVEWVSEPGYAEFPEGLKQGRFDAFCAPIGIIPSRARVSTTSIPLAYNPQIIYVREGGMRFKKPADLNNKDVVMATTDGEAFQVMTRRFFPEAIEHSLPNMSPPSQLFLDVVMSKADAVLHDPVLVHYFNRDNKGKYRLVPAFDDPIAVTPTSVLTVLPSETHLLNMFNVAFATLQRSGKIDEILNKYEIGPDVLYRVQTPYIVPNP